MALYLEKGLKFACGSVPQKDCSLSYFEMVGGGNLKSEGQVLIPDGDRCDSQGVVH